MRIAIIGTGPTGLYSLQSLTASEEHVEIALYEKGQHLGIGMPYSRQTATKMMLANIASIEIPPIRQDYLTWMRQKGDGYLRSYHLDPKKIDERSFTPRLMLGEYFHDQMMLLVDEARAKGFKIAQYPATEVTDIQAQAGCYSVVTQPETREAPFDKIILAMGHAFEEDDDLTDHYFPNPWSGLINVDIPATSVGILGTSLSAIDAAMAVADQHGRFVFDGDDLRYETGAKGELILTLMSWSGILPEADFYCPIPYKPLEIMTAEALQKALSQKEKFEAVFDLFKREIATADPQWAAKISLETLTAEGFEEAYFKDREENDSFKWARKNLDEALKNHREKRTVAWRYAILRMHEQVEDIITEFSDKERERFDATLKTVFVDNYAAVPPESIKRLLALRDAGVLALLALGDDYEMTNKADHVQIIAKGKEHRFNIFIDARGQRAMESKDIPLPSLREALLTAGYDEPELTEDFRILGVEGYENIHLASLPYLMEERPFVQGITASAEIGQIIAQSMGSMKSRRRLARMKP